MHCNASFAGWDYQTDNGLTNRGTETQRAIRRGELLMKVSNKSKRNILMFPVVLSTVILAYVAFFICIVLPNTAISLILAYGAVIVGGFAIIVGLLSTDVIRKSGR